VRDSNTSALAALASRAGFRVVAASVLGDDRAAIRDALVDALHSSDMAIVSGGSSMGERDLTAEIFEEVAGEGAIVHGIAVKPGRPTILSFEARTRTMLVGLPGHPVSAMTIFSLMPAWLYRKLTGQKEPFPIPARLDAGAQGTRGRTTLHAAALRFDGTGYVATPVAGKSGMISTMTRADGYFVIEADSSALEGTETTIYPY
jgi:molybdopterin molybdotransferase